MVDSKKKILVIDDDPSVSEALLMLLGDEFDPHAAASVREGVKLFGSLQPSVVILDLHLPDENGLDALRSIREMDRKVQVVILTGFATLDAVEESMRLGASDCLHKPFDASVLRTRVRELIDDECSGKEEMLAAESSASYGRLDDDLVSASFLHDVSNPLTSLQALTLLLKEKNNDSETTLKLTNMIEQNVSYLGSLVEQWRAFSAPKTLTPEYASLHDVAQQAAVFVRLRAEAKAVKLTLDTDGSDLSPNLNRHAVARILVNLLENAIEAAPRLGGEVNFRASERDGRAEFVVKDNGSGVAPDSTQKIFEASYTTKKKGAGLGLYIARSIVESVEGSITVCSRPGRGTTFTVELPSHR